MSSQFRSKSSRGADVGPPDSRPHGDSDGRQTIGFGLHPSLRFWVHSLAASGFFGLLFVGLGSLLFGSLDATFAFLNGQTLYVPNSELKAAPDPSEQFATAGLEIRNLSFSPCDIVGARTDCDCAVVDDLPTRIAPLTTRALQVRIASRPTNVADNSRVVELLTRASVNPVTLRIRVPSNREEHVDKH